MKEYAFIPMNRDRLWGGLPNYEMDWEKSADTIVGDKKRAIEKMEASRSH